ncbi:hypothetical protein [Micromonospora aurantiaca]|uniref:Uncharacterized protein n=1 Tax=Micromonospora aurantiaca (nom. illeg.) TaxID=47850 RepID=A0A6N3JWR1_9ACTN|nr:hypothetical protein [Micromonospora aurantiaca]AXH89443.1 hypothetical protein DVH21_05540 [Micromonospora aurantiaca]
MSHNDLIAGLRALADFLEANPRMPALTYPTLLDTGPVGETDGDGVKRVHLVAELLGSTVATSRSGHLQTGRQFDGLELRIAHVPSAASAQHEAHMTYASNVQPEDGTR